MGMVDGPNVYIYAGNNPVNLVDLWGLCEKKPWWKEALDWTWYNLLEPPYNTLTQPGYNYGEWIWGNKNVRTFYGASLDSIWLTTGIYGATETGASLGGWAAKTGPTVTWRGGEIVIKNGERTNIRINPFGNSKSQNLLGRRPHYHRRIIDPDTGEAGPGGGLGQHRPWEGGW